MTHRYNITVRWADLDPYRHVNHAIFFTYCEAARIDLLDEVGFSMQELLARDRHVVIGVEAKFLRPGLESRKLTVVTTPVEAKRAVTVWQQDIFDGDELLFSATISFAFTNLEGRPTRRPEGFLEAVSK